MRKPAALAVLAALGWLAAEAVAQSPKVVRTAPITMTGQAPSAQEISTPAISMTGLGGWSAQEIRTPPITMTGVGASPAGAQAKTINTGRIEMTGRR